MPPSLTMIFPPTTPQTRWVNRRPHQRGGEGVRDLSTVQPTLGRAGEQNSRLIPLAPCPVEGRGPSGRGCTPGIPTSTSNCSLRCGRDLAASITCITATLRNQSFRQSARKTNLDLHSSCLFHVGNSPRLVFLQLTQIPVHGYDGKSRPFPPVAPKGRTRESSHMRHGVPPHGSPHSTAIRPAVTPRFGLMRARRRER